MSAMEKIYVGHVTAELDYVKDGVVYCGVTPKNIMVESESDLAGLDGYDPGSVAFTADEQSKWRLDAQGEWKEIAPAETPADDQNDDQNDGQPDDQNDG